MATIHHHHNDDAQQPPTLGPATSFSASPSKYHPPLEPVSGKILVDQECRRRDALCSQGHLATGCGELDDGALAGGGFERGCVVGVSAEEGRGGGSGSGSGLAEEEGDVALVMGLQTVARMLVGARRRGEGLGRAMIISTMGTGTLAGLLRDVMRAQIAEAGSPNGVDRGELRELLGRIGISRVFDVPGLWEVLGELDRLPASQELGEEEEASREDDVPLEASADEQHWGADDRRQGTSIPSPPPPGGQGAAVATASLEAEALSSSPLSDPPSSLPDVSPWETTEMGETVLAQRTTPPGLREVIQDSEEEEESSLSPVALAGASLETDGVSISETGLEDTGELGQPETEEAQEEDDGLPSTSQHNSESEVMLPESSRAYGVVVHSNEKPPVNEPAKGDEATPPDIILITHMSTLLSSLFHQREKDAAHEMLQLLASHLRYLTRAPEYGGPLIMILNSTSSSSDTPSPNQHSDGAPTTPRPGGPAPPTPSRPLLDPTLRSIFNPPPLSAPGLPYSHDTPPHARRSKPSFGLVFSQMLDLHLLCTRVPRTRADAEALYAPPAVVAPAGGRRRAVEYAWVVEVLLDEIGVWEGRGKVLEGRGRRSREQRWGAVHVRRDAGGVKMVDAFEKKEEGERDVRVAVATGFGGRRV